jgi:hypothetical protein
MFQRILKHPLTIQLIKRLKSFLWHAAMMGAAVVVSVLIEYISTLDISGPEVMLLGLVLGQVSKFINDWLLRNPVVI